MITLEDINNSSIDVASDNEAKSFLRERAYLTKNSYLRAKRIMYIILQESMIFQALFFLLILLSIIVFMLMTLPQYFLKTPLWLLYLDLAINCLFTIEFLLRFWSSPSFYHFIKSPISWLEFIVVLSFWILYYLVTLIHSSVAVSYIRFFLILRVLRALIILRFVPLARPLRLALSALAKAKKFLFYIGFFIVFLIPFLGSLEYYAERTQEHFSKKRKEWIYSDFPNKGQYSEFQSIFPSLWYTIETLTTVGYGDIVPVTPVGKIVAVAIMLIGLLVAAFPIAVLVDAYITSYKQDPESTIHKQFAKRRAHQGEVMMHLEDEVDNFYSDLDTLNQQISACIHTCFELKRDLTLFQSASWKKRKKKKKR